VSAIALFAVFGEPSKDESAAVLPGAKGAHLPSEYALIRG